MSRIARGSRLQAPCTWAEGHACVANNVELHGPHAGTYDRPVLPMAADITRREFVVSGDRSKPKRESELKSCGAADGGCR